MNQNDYIPSEIILDLYENPINYGELKDYDLFLSGKNTSCGDIIGIYIKLSKDKKKIKKISYTHYGCVISKASGSITTDLVINKSIDDILNYNSQEILNSLGGVIETRQRCAFLAINILKKGLSSYLEDKKIPFNKFVEI
jgi:nitrogen fixation NifU-like protein